MKLSLSILALAFTAACGGSGGSVSNVPTTQSSAPSAGTASVVAPAPMAPTPVTPTSANSFAAGLNNVRSRNGAAPVTFDARLGRAAQGHANDMLANGFFSHTGSNGSNGGQRISAQGYQWRTWGENIARGQQSEDAVLNAWVNSPGHQRNNVNPDFEDFALARAGSGSNLYWVLVLAAER